MLIEEQLKVLEKAREVYGDNAQILVAIEELLELACVLAKFPRYDDKNEARAGLKDKAVDEIADVVIILDHVQKIFDVDDRLIAERIQKKVSRLDRWLSHSNSMQETIDDRSVEESCDKCQNRSFFGICSPCLAAQGTEGRKPYYKSKKE